MTNTLPGESELRDQLVAAMQRLDALGLNRGSTGNLSHRLGAGMVITPTGIGAGDLRSRDLVWLGDDRDHLPPDSFYGMALRDSAGAMWGNRDSLGIWMQVKGQR